MPDEIVTADVLARWLGVGATNIRQLVNRGVIERAGPNQFRLEECVRCVVPDMRKQLGRRGGRGVAAESAAERARLARAQADLATAKADLITGRARHGQTRQGRRKMR